MDSYFIGQILLWPNRYVPAGWALCNGQALQVGYYQALYSIIGNIYGGNSTSFNLPNLNNSVVIGQGLGPGLINNYQLAAKGGETTVALSLSNLPPHTHAVTVQNNGAINATVNVSKNPGTSTTPNSNLVIGGLSVQENGSGLTSANLYNSGGGSPYNIPLNMNVAVQTTNTVIGISGTNNPTHNNMMPYQNLFYIICTTDGLYPNFQD